VRKKIVFAAILLTGMICLMGFIWYYMGNVYRTTKPMAIDILKSKVVILKPVSFDDQLQQAKYYWEVKDLDNAIPSLIVAVRLNPDNAEAKELQLAIASYCLTMANSDYVKGNYSDAATLLEKSTNLKPDAIRSLGLLAKCYQQTGDYSKAEIQLKKILAIDPANTEAASLLSKLQEEVKIPLGIIQGYKTKKGTVLIDAVNNVLQLARQTKTIITEECWTAEPITNEAESYMVYFTYKEDTSGNGKSFGDGAFVWKVNINISAIKPLNKNAEILMQKW